MTWAVHVSLAPTWFDPAETASVITPFMMLYALHDAMVKPMPGNPMTPSLAESWSVSKDGLAYDFTLRKGVKFHNGDPVTAEDVKFSLERYRGGAATTLKERVAGVDVVDPLHVRIRLKKPWPDFMTFYAHAGHGRGLGRAQALRGAGGGGRLQESAGRRRPLPLRVVHAGRSSWCWRPTRATGGRRRT